MSVLVLHRPKRKTTTMEIHVAGKVVCFRLRTLEATGESVMVAAVDDEAVIRAFRRNANFDVIGDDEPVLEDRRPGVAAEPAETVAGGYSYPPIVQRSFANGWRYEDITGAGRDNQWGEEGGRSDRAGLTMAEHSLTVPPEGWAERCLTHYPWESLGWKPPGEGWAAPKLPAKRPSAVAEPRVDEKPLDEAQPDPVDEPVDEDTDVDTDIGGDEDIDDESAPAPAAVVSARPRAAKRPEAAKPAKAPETRSEEALGGWPASQIELAQSTLADVWRASGSAPSPSKARHHLKKAGIPTVSTEQVQTLLDRVQPTL